MSIESPENSPIIISPKNKEYSLSDIIIRKMHEVDDDIHSRHGEDYSSFDLLIHSPDQLLKGTILLLGLVFLAPPDSAIRGFIGAVNDLIYKNNTYIDP